MRARLARPERAGLEPDVARWLGLDLQAPWLLAVAMLRRGDKLRRFRCWTGDAAAADTRWQLVVVGDGPARTEVQRALCLLWLAGRVRRVQTEEAMKNALLARATSWYGRRSTRPTVWRCSKRKRAGLPVVAGRREGVAEIV